MRLIVPQRYQTDLLSDAAGRAAFPLHISLDGLTYSFEDHHAPAMARAVGYSVFPAWERRCLDLLTVRGYACLDRSRQKLLPILAQTLINEDVYREPPGGGVRRCLRVSRLTEESLLRQGWFDFHGFCRFTLKGYPGYLRHMLTLAADELLAEEEQQECLDMLRRISCGQHRRLRLFFSPGYICHVWEQDDRGVRLREGGCLRQGEDVFCANIFALQPELIWIRGAQYAPTVVLSWLNEVLGERIVYEQTDELDNPL